MFIASKRFWAQLTERAVKSAAQGGILALGADQVNVLDLDWSVFAGFAAGAALLSALTSLASGGFGNDDSPSLVE